MGIFCSAFVATAVISFLCGTCWLLKVFTEDITNDLQFLEVNESSSAENYAKLRENLYKVIQNTSDIKQLSITDLMKKK